MVGLLAHAVHLLLVILGLVGVVVLLLPQAQEARSRRTAFRAPASAAEHEQRVAALRAAVQSGTLTTPPDPSTFAPQRTPAHDTSMWRVLAVTSSVASAGVHAAVFPHHLEEAVVVGIFFLVVTVAQMAWSYLVCLDATRERLLAGIVGSLGLVALWSVSRSVGLPWLGREPVGWWDLASGFWELVVVGTCLVGLRRPLQQRALALGGLGRLAWSWIALSGLVLVVLTLTVPHT
jgi:hypothetical protein